MQPIKIIEDLYIPILAGLHVYPDEGGILHRIHRESNKVCEVNKRTLCLPTDLNLKNLNQTEYMFFHPMSENIARGDSVIYNYIKLILTLRVNYSIMAVASILLSIANDKTLDGKLKSHQLDLLAALPKVDKKTVDHFSTAIGKTDLDSNVFFSVYNRRNGKVDGVTYNRAAVVHFPLVSQLTKPEDSTFWSSVKGIRKADYANYLSLFNYLLPEWDVDNKFSGVSDSMEAPSFHALIDSFTRVMARLNEVLDKFSDLTEPSEIDDIYCKELDTIKASLANLQKYANIISPLDGNMGECAANDAQVNKMQHKPIGIPPIGSTNASEAKFESVNTAVSNNANWQQTQVPQPPTQVNQPAQNQGFIGFGPGTIQAQRQNQNHNQFNGGFNQPQIIGYTADNQPIYSQPPRQNSFIGYPNQNQQQMFNAPPVSDDPIQQWNNAVSSMQNQQPVGFGQNQYGGFGQNQFGGFGQNQFGSPAFNQQSAVMNNQFGGYNNPRPTFRKQGEPPVNAGGKQLPGTFGQQSQPAFGQPSRPTFRTAT